MSTSNAGLDALTQLLTVRELAALLRISEAWLRQHSSGAKQPRVPCVRIGNRYRYDPAEVAEFLRRQVQ